LQIGNSHFSRRKDADNRGKQQQREKANQPSNGEIRQVQASMIAVWHWWWTLEVE
jgi:hypothetical protein